MIFDSPIPFLEALQSREVKSLLPTTLSSRELSAISVAIRERSIFAARVVISEFLDQTNELVTKILQGKTISTEGEPRLPAMDLPAARLHLKQFLQSIAYTPAQEDAGTIKDLRTNSRLNLILDTNTSMAQGYGWWEQGQDEAVLDEWPAQELVRVSDRKEKRNWYQRWRAAGGKIYPGKSEGQPLIDGAANEGRCIALKDDPIWTNISAFDQPYPPFDFNSGVDVRDVSRDEAIKLGLIDRDTQIEPQTRGFNEDLQVTPRVRSTFLRSALEAEGYVFDGNVLTIGHS